MQMTLAKALKHRKRVTEYLANLDAAIGSNNSVIAGNSREIDVEKALTERAVLVGHLITVKLALIEGSAPIRERILRISELKGLITTLKTLDTKHGKQVIGYRETETSYDAQIKATDVNARVVKLEKEIDSIQEEIDAFNYKTFADIPELAE